MANLDSIEELCALTIKAENAVTDALIQALDGESEGPENAIKALGDWIRPLDLLVEALAADPIRLPRMMRMLGEHIFCALHHCQEDGFPDVAGREWLVQAASDWLCARALSERLDEAVA